MNTILTTTGLTKCYGSKKAVDNLNMHVPEKSIYGFIGINGAGKTTTFGMLGKTIIPTSGSFSCHGSFSLLPQDARFYYGRKVLDQLTFFAELSGVARKYARGEALKALEIVGLEEKAKSSVEKLSHGMYKRLGIAQSILGAPDVIALDEPTAGLDPETAHDIRKLIKELHKKSTIIISSHNLAELAELCTHFGIIHNGSLLYEGPGSDMIRSNCMITYHLTTTALLPILDMPWIKGKDVQNNTLHIHIDTDRIRIEEANMVIVELLWKHQIGVQEISLGKSLEESFFSYIGKSPIS